jgi:Na+/H+ antiporter NhaC
MRFVRFAILLLLLVLVVLTAWQARREPGVTPEETYGLYTLTPALVAIGLAIVTRQVLPSLALGVVVASFMLLPFLPDDADFATERSWVAGLRVAVETYVVGAMTDADHIKIIIFTLTIGGMVGVISANGGTAALVQRVARGATGRRAGQLVAWVAGWIVFFDDYANSMIVGPTMKPVFDRLRLSRAKLAYVVDSTAAPVASIALVGTWIGAEVGYIQDGLDALSRTGTPPALADVTAYESFLYSLPHRFYPILALLMVGMIAVTGRDFGPMAAAERKAGHATGTDTDPAASRRPAFWWLAAVPVLLLITGTVGIILVTGFSGVSKNHTFRLQDVLTNADPYASILYAAIASLAVAVALGAVARAAAIKDGLDAAMKGMGTMLPAVVILVFAWALSASTQALHLGTVATTFLQQADVSVAWLPLWIFLAAAGVSLATGTSWGTMAILCPVAVEVVGRLVVDLPADAGREVFYASVGSVLAGAIFGDHCSPISDTTVLSAAASGCSLEDHVWTQAPYAAVAALVAILTGNILGNVLGLPVWFALAIGIGSLALIVRLAGRPAAGIG